MMVLYPVLILTLLPGDSAEVVDDFQKRCGHFFANGNPPTILPGNQYKQICQTLNATVYYATLYDTASKIPVYSAYKFEGRRRHKRQNLWKIEPQLDDLSKGADMVFESVRQSYGLYQAINEDYKLSNYHKGHLAPVSHASSQEFVHATFTLTNAAPQDKSFNQGQWRRTEKMVANTLSSQCSAPDKAYIITGVIPGHTRLKGTITVPSDFWCAFCCVNRFKTCSVSGGVIGANNNIQPVQWMSLPQLERRLTKLYGVFFQLFH